MRIFFLLYYLMKYGECKVLWCSVLDKFFLIFVVDCFDLGDDLNFFFLVFGDDGYGGELEIDDGGKCEVDEDGEVLV